MEEALVHPSLGRATGVDVTERHDDALESFDPPLEKLGLERFVEDRAARLWRAAWLLVGDRHHAEDLVQTALSKCYGRYDSMPDDGEFEAYLRTTIYRTFVSWWRRKSWRNERPTEFLREDSAIRDGEAAVRMDVRRALAELPRMQRAVIILQYLEDRSVQEIAADLGITVGSVKTHSHRGRAALARSGHLSGESALDRGAAS